MKRLKLESHAKKEKKYIYLSSSLFFCKVSWIYVLYRQIMQDEAYKWRSSKPINCPQARLKQEDRNQSGIRLEIKKPIKELKPTTSGCVWLD